MLARRLLVVTLLVGCGGNGGGNNGDDDHPGDGGSDTDGGSDQKCGDTSLPFTVHAETIASTGLVQPVYVQQAPGGDDLYVVEKLGKIVIVRNGSVLATPFIDLTSEVNIPNSTSEGGLLSVAFHKDYATNGRFFVYATVKGGSGERVAVQEYHRSDANHDVADPFLVGELISESHNALGNVGGTVMFGPDGYLWLATGDAARQDSPAKDLVSYLGKVLRIDIDDQAAIPPGGINGSRIWDYGLRNPYRFSFDRVTHDLFIADPGDEGADEVDIEAAGTGQKNYGWDIMEGKHCLDGTTTCNMTGLTLPQFERAHGSSFGVIIGGVNYRGSIANMRCHYIYAVFGRGQIMSFVWDGSTVKDERELSDMFGDVEVLQVTSIVEDSKGELLMTSMPNDSSGFLYRIVGN